MIIEKRYTWIELDKKAFHHNVSLYRSIIGPNAKLSVVIKSNAYGHGTREIALLCQESKDVDWLCSASLSDALYKRSLGITKPILVLSIIDESIESAILQSIHLPVFEENLLYQLNEIGERIGTKVAIHIKVDTGMSRFGFTPEKAFEMVKIAHALPHIDLQGIFTHCAEGNSKDLSFTMQQLEKFDNLCANIEAIGIKIPYIHAAKSAIVGSVNHLFPRFNFVRVGAGIYGLLEPSANPTDKDLSFKQVMTWKTKIFSLKEVPENSPIGYDRTYTTSRRTTIAFLPIGYFESYDRRLSNKGIVLIRGEYYARVIGRVCMNATIIEIPEGKTVSVGDEVILLGDHPDVHVYEISNLIESYNPREITTRLQPATERIIIESDASLVTDIQQQIEQVEK